MSLTSLPTEILQYIHYFAGNEAFPQTHSVIYRSLSLPSSNFAAKYLLRLHRHHGAKEVLQRSARFPVCTLAVVKEIERIWKRSSSRDLLCEELPRRLFRQYTKDNLPLLRHLLDSHNASPNSHKGYPLCRAVLVQDYDLIALLLSYGADPGIKLSLPIQVAISLKDLKAVRMLIDGIPDPRDGEETRVKRQRKGNHVIVTPLLVECALNKGSKEIVEYFVKEKGVMPKLHSILKLGK